MNIPLTHIPGTPRKSDAKPGMAHFAGTGPLGKTCRSCIFCIREQKKHYCHKYTHLMGMDKSGPAIEPEYEACRYFEGAV